MNLIWIVSDTVRSDAVGCYGNRRMRTPSIDRLASRGVRFNRHYLSSFPTMPARADFMTGRWTMSYMQWEPLGSDEITLAEVIAAHDIDTAAIVDTPFFLRDGMGYDRGFMTFSEIPGHYYVAKGRDRRRMDAIDMRPPVRMEMDCFAPQTFARAMQWLELHYKDRFFLYVDTWDPHEPWNAPDYYTEMYWPDYKGEQMRPLYGYMKDKNITEDYVKKAQATYMGEMTMVDTWTGNLLSQVERMGLLENTAVIFTTDHGYNFGEHGGLYGKMVFAHGEELDDKKGEGAWARSPLFNEVTRIPLIIYVPGIKPAVYDGLTAAVDLMPTVLDILGLDVPSRVEGSSLLPALNDPSSAGRDFVVSSQPFINSGDTDLCVDHVRRKSIVTSMSTVTSGDWTLLYDPAPGCSELYNVKNDPAETVNVIRDYPDVAVELHRKFVQFLRDTKVPQRLFQPRIDLRM
ncbi:MAG: sulfatase [Dehalococcoidales bacterium]|nr:sulfatase [Dehalococcoidales bacterium]